MTVHVFLKPYKRKTLLFQYMNHLLKRELLSEKCSRCDKQMIDIDHVIDDQ